MRTKYLRSIYNNRQQLQMKERQRSRQKKHNWYQKGSFGRHRQRMERQRFRRDIIRDIIREKQKIEVYPDINRNQVCPFLARIYYSINNTNIYEKQSDIPKDRQIILMNSTVKQITELLRAHLPIVRTKQRFVFSKISLEDGKYVKEEIGSVLVHKKGIQKEDIRLDSQKFCIGDLIDVSINFK